MSSEDEGLRSEHVPGDDARGARSGARLSLLRHRCSSAPSRRSACVCVCTRVIRSDNDAKALAGRPRCLVRRS